MKFIDELDLELVNQTLNFDTAERKITGGCDIFTTKPVASDKKLYKTIDRHLDSLLQENQSYNLAVQKQIELEECQLKLHQKNDPTQVTQQQQQEANQELFSLDSERQDDSGPGSGNSVSFWEQKRRMSISDTSQQNPLAFKSHKLNDQNLKELMNSASENGGYISSSSVDSQFGRMRRNSSTSSLPGGESNQHIPKRRTSSIGSNPTGGSASPLFRRCPSVTRETVTIGPFGPINETSSRRTFAYLIAILNASYPDHEFNSLDPSDFVRSSMKQLVSKFENSIIALGKQPQEWIWETINAHMDLADCIFYQYNPQKSFLDDEPGHLWSLLWFMFNKKRKRVAFFYLSAFRLKNPPLTANSISMDEDYDTTSKNGDGEKRRRTTIEHETNDFEGEYDLTYNSGNDSAVQDDTDHMTDN